MLAISAHAGSEFNGRLPPLQTLPAIDPFSFELPYQASSSGVAGRCYFGAVDPSGGVGGSGVKIRGLTPAKYPVLDSSLEFEPTGRRPTLESRLHDAVSSVRRA